MIEGVLKDLLQGPAAGESADDYLLVRLTDQQAILDALGKLREVYPNVLHLERPGLQAGRPAELSGRDHLKRSELELFKAFHEEVTGSDLIHGGEQAFLEVVESLRKAEREGVA
jgi:exonuclease SbcD